MLKLDEAELILMLSSFDTIFHLLKVFIESTTNVMLNALAVTGTTIKYNQAEVKTMQMDVHTGRIGLQTPGCAWARGTRRSGRVLTYTKGKILYHYCMSRNDK